MYVSVFRQVGQSGLQVLKLLYLTLTELGFAYPFRRLCQRIDNAEQRSLHVLRAD